MSDFFENARAVIEQLVEQRTNSEAVFHPSSYWADFARNFRYVYGLPADELERIRYHTYHLTSDIYLTYYFAEVGFKGLLARGFEYFCQRGDLLRYDEGQHGIGILDDQGRRVSHDLLRYLGTLVDLKESGIFSVAGHQVVVEFGGGYGGLARGHFAQNSQTSYVICDLEETLFFSAVYLRQHVGAEKVHLVTDKILRTDLQPGHLYLVAQSQRDHIADLEADYAISQQSLQEMTLLQVEKYLNWIKNRCKAFYSCNITDHGELAENKGIVRNLPGVFSEVLGMQTWTSTPPENHERFGDNHLTRMVYRC